MNEIDTQSIAVVCLDDIKALGARVDERPLAVPAAVFLLDEDEVIHIRLSGAVDDGLCRGRTGVALVVVTDEAPDPSALVERYRSLVTHVANPRTLLTMHGEGDMLEVRCWCHIGGEWVERRVHTYALADAFSRGRGIFESDCLLDREVAIVGLGSGGSLIAVELAKARVGRFVLVDCDRLEAHNIGRHTCGITDLGRYKTRAVADRIREKNPLAQVEILNADVVDAFDQFTELTRDTDVFVAATDNNRSRRSLNRLGLDTQRSVIFGRAFIRACGGDVIRLRPGQGPCYDCLTRNAKIEEEVSHSPTAEIPAYARTAMTAEPGLSVDIAPISLMCARLVLQELLRGSRSALTSLDDDLVGDLYIWANRREHQFAGWRPMRYGYSSLAVQRWYAFRAEQDPTCPTCNEDGFITRLLHEHERSMP